MFAHLRRRHHAANATLQHSRQLSRRERSLSHLQHATVSGAAGLPCEPVCRLQRCALRWHPVQMDAALRLCRTLCPDLQVSPNCLQHVAYENREGCIGERKGRKAATAAAVAVVGCVLIIHDDGFRWAGFSLLLYTTPPHPHTASPAWRDNKKKLFALFFRIPFSSQAVCICG